MDLDRNQLAHERSPYLQEHKEDLIFWQPWSESAFELAKELDRPVFMSIG